MDYPSMQYVSRQPGLKDFVVSAWAQAKAHDRYTMLDC